MAVAENIASPGNRTGVAPQGPEAAGSSVRLAADRAGRARRAAAGPGSARSGPAHADAAHPGATHRDAVDPNAPSDAVDSDAASAEAARMEAVHRYDALDTASDGAFDRIAAMAARWFGAPMAAVTMVDGDRVRFMAAYGLGDLAETARVPGLCATAILSGGPLVIPDTAAHPEARANPLVTGHPRARCYAAAPIVTADGHRLGTVHVMDTRPRPISAADAATLTDLAAIVMDELELRLSAREALRAEHARLEAAQHARARAERDRAALASFAATLQRTLLPPALPSVPGLELACHYRTASPHDVGGDFYDVFPIGRDRWAFFLGDVCGKGAEAASMTSLTRYTLRAAALREASPAEVLGALNTALLLDSGTGIRFCTVVFGVLEPHPDGGFLVSTATGGHPPPLHLTGTGTGAETGHDGAVGPVGTPGGMLVGAFADAFFASHTFRLAPGAALLLYSDGLTEARGADGARLGEAGLTGFLAGRSGPCAAVALVTDTVALLEDLPGGGRDDVALLAMSVPGR